MKRHVNTNAHKMKKAAAISVRVAEPVKEAMERAAEEDSRSVASLAEKLFVEFLRKNGYLQK